MLLVCPRLQQLVTALELGALHARMPRRMAREAPVELALGARHHQAVLVGGRQRAAVDRQHVAAAWTRPAQWVAVGLNEELRVACLVGTAQSRKNLVAVHQRAAVGTDALDLQLQTSDEHLAQTTHIDPVYKSPRFWTQNSNVQSSSV